MVLSRWDPFRDLMGIQSELNRLFGRTFGAVDGAEPGRGSSWAPVLDVYEIYSEVSEDAFHRIERRFGSFARSLSLPSTADPEGIDASFDAGVLTIQIPKKDEAKPKKIAIKAKG